MDYEINVDRLTEYAIELRYPGDVLFPSIQETNKAIELAEKVKEFVISKLREEGFSFYETTN